MHYIERQLSRFRVHCFESVVETMLSVTSPSGRTVWGGVVCTTGVVCCISLLLMGAGGKGGGGMGIGPLLLLFNCPFSPILHCHRVPACPTPSCEDLGIRCSSYQARQSLQVPFHHVLLLRDRLDHRDGGEASKGDG